MVWAGLCCWVVGLSVTAAKELHLTGHTDAYVLEMHQSHLYAALDAAQQADHGYCQHC